MVRKWLGLAALMPAIAMVFVDQSVLPVALPRIQEQLGATHTELWWCINSYLLSSAVLMLAGGKLGDRLGYRRAFMWGIWVFAIASALCGLSVNVAWLIGARTLQGLGAALMIPASSPLIMTLFSQKERGKAIGINVSVSSLFLVLAPMIGGYFTEEFSWRWIFWINLPLAATGLILIPMFIPRSSPKKHTFDFLGFCFFTLGLSCLVVLIMQGRVWGWTSFLSVCFSVFCFLNVFFLIRRERKSEHPFIDLSLFRHPIYKAVNISVFATQFVLMITIYRALFFQEVMEWSPVKVGVIFSVTSMPVLFMSLVGGWLADRSGAKVPIAIGFTLLICSFFWTAFFVHSSLFMIVLGFLAFGVGVPLIFTPTYSSAMGSIPPQKSGAAFGILATVRGVAATLGVAIISSFAKQVQWHSFRSMIKENPITKVLDASTLESLARGVESVEGSLSSDQIACVLRYTKESEVRGFVVLHVVLGLTLLIAFMFVFVLYQRKASHHPPAAPAEGWD